MRFVITLSVVIFTKILFCQSDIDSANYFLKITDYSKAHSFYQKWIEENRSHPHYDSILLELANTKRILHKYSEAFDIYVQMGTMSDKIDRRSLLTARINKADLYRQIFDTEGSLKLFNSITFSKSDSINYQNLLCKKMHRLAALFNETDVLDSALYYSRKALEISEENQFVNDIPTSYNEIANIFEKQNKLDSAVYYYDKACAIWEKNNQLRYYSNGYFNRARVFFNMKQYDSATYHFNKNLDLIKNYEWPEIKSPIYNYLKEISLVRGDSMLWYKYHVKQLEQILIQKTLDFNKNLQVVKIDFETQEKDKLIKLKEFQIKNQELELDKTQSNFRYLFLFLLFVLIALGLLLFLVYRIKTTNKRQKSLLKENEFLLEESNHRIKNNLQLVTSILYNEVEKSEQEEKSILIEALGKIEAISTLHKHLYISQNKELISLKNYLNDVKFNFDRFFEKKNVRANFKIEEVDLPIQKATYIGLLITELLINSLKHAFKSTSQPTITLTTFIEKDVIYFDYRDNGNGIFKNKENPKLVELLCKQLKANYKITTEKGFAIKFNFKL